MAKKGTGGGLTAEERRITKALLAKRWRNQDIQALLNSGGEMSIVPVHNILILTIVELIQAIATHADHAPTAYRLMDQRFVFLKIFPLVPRDPRIISVRPEPNEACSEHIVFALQ